MDVFKRHKGKFITALIILAVLVTAWYMSGSVPAENHYLSNTAESQMPDTNTMPNTTGTSAPDNAEGTPADAAPVLGNTASAPDNTTPAPANITDAPAPANITATPAPDNAAKASEAPKHNTPISEDTMSDMANTVTLTVRCDTILNNLNRFNNEKTALIPADGIILQVSDVIFHEGESVFNVLLREMKKAKIHMSFRNTPIYNSAYIEAINNIYEFDCGELSGWMYKVNGSFPNYGSSRYQLKAGDVIEWLYTCDLGRDIGGEAAAGGQAE